MTPAEIQASDTSTPGMQFSDQLRMALRFVRRRWVVLVGIPIIAVLVSIGVSLHTRKEYDATAQVELTPNTSNVVAALLNPAANSTSADPERDLNTAVSQITIAPVGQRVVSQLHLHEPVDTLLREVDANLEGTTNIVDVIVTDANPQRAQAISNAFANQFVVYRAQYLRDQYNQAVSQGQIEYKALTPVQKAGTVGVQLQNKLQALQQDANLQTSDAQLLQSATVPTSPSKPKKAEDAILALILGLILAVAVAVVLELIDGRLRGEEEAREISGLATLAVVPRPRGGRMAKLSSRSRESSSGSDGGRKSPGAALKGAAKGQDRLSLDPQQVDSLRALAVNLSFFRSGRDAHTLMISSTREMDGKTSVTLGLAAAFAELGKRVIAVECDMRRPRYADYLSLPATPGLSSVLTGLIPASEALLAIDARSLRPARSDARTSLPRFSVLPSGPAPANPRAMLSAPVTAELIEELRSQADMVLIDTPAIGLLNDAVPLIAQVDGVVLVARVEHATREGLQRTCRILRQLDANVLGLVVTGERVRPGSGGYGSLEMEGRPGAVPPATNGRVDAELSSTGSVPRPS
jgi:succinoglycan biosynthesis transport protein ExoP